MVEIHEYTDGGGRSPFHEWFDQLNAQAAGKVTTALRRAGNGNFSNVKSAGSGVFECRINFGPGYRVYLGNDGGRLVILLAGGAKKRQQNDIRLAVNRWEDYKQQRQQQKEEE